MGECTEQDDEGRQCERSGAHTMHRASTEWSFVTWGEPDPVRRPGKKKKKRVHSNEEMIAFLHQVEGSSH